LPSQISRAIYKPKPVPLAAVVKNQEALRKGHEQAVVKTLN
jgi:hypothetical protein